MFRRPAVWIAALVVCGAATIFAYLYFPLAFPLVSVDIRMDRQGALASASELAERFGWGPEDYREAASFDLEPEVQEFVELEGGGPEAFREMLAEGSYHPYRWRVRHFKELERNETTVTFTPAGEPYGFRQQLAEDAPGAALTAEAALPIAEGGATGGWGIDLAAFERVESSQETRPGGRIDHTFVFERIGVRYGEGRQRLRLVVGGDELTELTHFLEVPEAFTRRFAEMRSTNTLIGALAQFGAILGYLLIGCSVALFFLFRERWVLWETPLIWGALVAFLQVLVVANQLPLLWMQYDTALSAQNFLLQQIGIALLLFAVMTGVFAVSFMAAETMTRRAFPDHIQLWRSWSPGVANSPAIAGRTAMPYLLVGLFFAYEVVLYFVAHNLLGWWSPSSALFNPNVLATYFPWLTAIAISLQAGFWEECLFRAVPLAGAALIGQRYGRPKAWIAGAFIVQALIFGAGHAPYPTQPAYARVVELIIPSLGFGLIYLYFGLLPGIILHYAYDVVWFAMPLFAQSAPGAWIDRTILVLFALVPVIIVLARRARAGRWVEVAAEVHNGAWEPPPALEPAAPVPVVMAAGAMGAMVRRLVLVAGGVGLVLWIAFTGFAATSPPLEIDRQEAIRIAREELDRRGIELQPEWWTMAYVASLPGEAHRFVWQEGGPDPFAALSGAYLGVPRWIVRFARFEGDVAERAEQYFVHVSSEGRVTRFTHRLPEARPGADLSEEEARQIAGRFVREGFGVASGDLSEPGGLQEISAETAKRPERRDWTFTFEDPGNYPLEQGSARVEVQIAGDEPADANRFVHVPEEWARADRNRQVVPGILSVAIPAIVALLVFAGAIAGGVAWARGRFSVRAFVIFLAAAMALTIFEFANGWPATVAGFSSDQPIAAQVVILLAGVAVASVGLAVVLALLAGWLHRLLHEAEGKPPPWGDSLAIGASCGLLVAGGRAALAAAGPSPSPPWAFYANADAFSPVLGTALDPVSGFLSRTLFLLLVCIVIGRWTQGWRRRTGPAAALLVSIGFAASTDPTEGIIAWLATGAALGAVILVLYRFVVRHDLTVLPAAVAAPLILVQARNAVLDAHPGAVAGRIGAIVVIAAIAVLWTKALRREDAPGPAAAAASAA